MTDQKVLDDAELVTQAQYASMRACSREAVRRAVDAGRISAFGPDKKVRPALADVEWQENTRARIGSRPASESAAPDSASAAPPAPAPAAPDYNFDRARRERADADLKEMELQERLGQLVRADAVREALASQLGQVRESLLQMPARLAPMLAAEPDQARMQTLLDGELRAVLAKLTDVEF